MKNKNLTICYWIVDPKNKITDEEYEAVEQEMDDVMRNLIVNHNCKVMNFQDRPLINTLN